MPSRQSGTGRTRTSQNTKVIQWTSTQATTVADWSPTSAHTVYQRPRRKVQRSGNKILGFGGERRRTHRPIPHSCSVDRCLGTCRYAFLRGIKSIHFTAVSCKELTSWFQSPAGTEITAQSYRSRVSIFDIWDSSSRAVTVTVTLSTFRTMATTRDHTGGFGNPWFSYREEASKEVSNTKEGTTSFIVVVRSTSKG